MASVRGAQTQVRTTNVYVDRETSRRFDRLCMRLGTQKAYFAALGCSENVGRALMEQGRVQREAYERALRRLEEMGL